MDLKPIKERQKFAGVWVEGPRRNLEDYQIIEALIREIERLRAVGK